MLTSSYLGYLLLFSLVLAEHKEGNIDESDIMSNLSVFIPPEK